jgi:hypothetical protein
LPRCSSTRAIIATDVNTCTTVKIMCNIELPL